MSFSNKSFSIEQPNLIKNVLLVKQNQTLFFNIFNTYTNDRAVHCPADIWHNVAHSLATTWRIWRLIAARDVKLSDQLDGIDCRLVCSWAVPMLKYLLVLLVMEFSTFSQL